MSPCHKFFCLREVEMSYAQYNKYFRCPADIEIDDDLLRYISDTTAWIPTLHLSPSGSKPNHNFDFYGSTVINRTGVKVFHEIVNLWKQLLSVAPQQIKLTGSWVCPVEFVSGKEIEGKGYYEELLYDRDSVIESLEKLSVYAHKVESDGCFILHIGI